MIAKGLASTRHPILAHVVPMRRCNLACTYCNEYDDFSAPVPLEEMHQRIDHLGKLGTAIVTISGGEPTLHPELDEIIRRIRNNGMIAGLITNGYFLTPERIERLNQAGLQHLQISIDNVNPDDVSKKSLKVLDQKLRNLAEHAHFYVNINSVIGSGIKDPEDAVTVAERAVALGFSTTLGIIHDGSGKLVPLGAKEMSVYDRLRVHGKKSYARFLGFREDLAHGRPHNWRCRAGGRYLYICEDGKVHLCSQQRGYPGVPLVEFPEGRDLVAFVDGQDLEPVPQFGVALIELDAARQGSVHDHRRQLHARPHAVRAVHLNRPIAYAGLAARVLEIGRAHV